MLRNSREIAAYPVANVCPAPQFNKLTAARRPSPVQPVVRFSAAALKSQATSAKEQEQAAQHQLAATKGNALTGAAKPETGSNQAVAP